MANEIFMFFLGVVLTCFVGWNVIIGNKNIFLNVVKSYFKSLDFIINQERKRHIEDKLKQQEIKAFLREMIK